ncbi:hypothetical protein HKCCE2091_16005 [Rhodobacterales bacterium HKCCE2091]|nr:hypothetical protein [Rhodobacterales bacterium HKCCE2091]
MSGNPTDRNPLTLGRLARGLFRDLLRDVMTYLVGAVGGAVAGGVVASFWAFPLWGAVLAGAGLGFFATIFLVNVARGD